MLLCSVFKKCLVLLDKISGILMCWYFNDILKKFTSILILKQCENVKELNKSSAEFESNQKKKKKINENKMAWNDFNFNKLYFDRYSNKNFGIVRVLVNTKLKYNSFWNTLNFKLNQKSFHTTE